MKMTTEEAFVKTLQMHGIEHAFGIIGSAMMPISDLFGEAGITFWDCAHEGSGGFMADGYTRATGKTSMMIAQNGPGITNFVTAVKTAYWEPHTVAVGHAASRKQDDRSGRLSGNGTDAHIPGLRRLSGRGARPVPHGRGPEPRDPASEARLGPGADQPAARFLDAGDRHRPASGRGIRASEWRRGCDSEGRRPSILCEIPRHPERCGRRPGPRHSSICGSGRAPRRAGLRRLPA